jgi:hypothetical protein
MSHARPDARRIMHRLHRLTLAIGLSASSTAVSAAVRADDAPAPDARPPSPPAPPPRTRRGVAVVALPRATDACWPLAQSVYGAPDLRPPSVDDAHARVLCGDAPPGAPGGGDLRDLADTVATLRGDDAPSRALLGTIARLFAVRAVVVVDGAVQGAKPTARVFLADAEVFDAAVYFPDEGSPVAWSAARRSLVRAFGADPPAKPGPPPCAGAGCSPDGVHAPSLATHDGPKRDAATPSGHAFYESGWFWGALGAAAFAGGAVFLATRDTGTNTIHVQLRVPH